MLRGVAAMAVVAHHAFAGGTKLGAAGVDLFFVISGFIMATCAGGRSPGQFLADRAWRIYPLWLIAVLPWLLMEPVSLLGLVRSLTLWPVYGRQYVEPALGVGWTLSFELLFYAGFAVAIASRASIPLLIFGLCLILGLTTNNLLFWFIGSPLAFEFLLGVAIAQMPSRASFGAVAAALGLILLAVAPDTYYDQSFGGGAILRVICWGVPASLLVYGLRSLEPRLSGRAFDLPVLIGNASYSIYLFHQLIFKQFHGIGGLVLSAAAGIAIYFLVERPIIRARPKWTRGWKSGRSGQGLAPHVADTPLLAGIAPRPADAVVEHRERLARN
ncbi:acyltransferase family protein [Sphingomonas sp. URHD0057]|uniref:acyltransferase family protein n=1 Tax=Sphingomonas sp. URHD0057 TaxID=1380389 RepID=UPI003FA782D2